VEILGRDKEITKPGEEGVPVTTSLEANKERDMMIPLRRLVWLAAVLGTLVVTSAVATTILPVTFQVHKEATNIKAVQALDNIPAVQVLDDNNPAVPALDVMTTLAATTILSVNNRARSLAWETELWVCVQFSCRIYLLTSHI
jgi:hypothetical protein